MAGTITPAAGTTIAAGADVTRRRWITLGVIGGIVGLIVAPVVQTSSAVTAYTPTQQEKDHSLCIIISTNDDTVGLFEAEHYCRSIGH